MIDLKDKLDELDRSILDAIAEHPGITEKELISKRISNHFTDFDISATLSYLTIVGSVTSKSDIITDRGYYPITRHENHTTNDS